MALDEEAKPLQVAVVGGDICGLTVAVGLQRAGLNVDIYEAAEKFGEVGAGVGLVANALKSLKDLGLLNEVLEKCKPQRPAAPLFRYLSGHEGYEVFYNYPLDPELEGIGIHRPVFLEALMPLFNSLRVHLNKRCVSLSETSDSRMKLYFSDGTTAEADVILGADGIRSHVRSFVVGSGITKDSASSKQDTSDAERIFAGASRATFTNTLAYRGLVPLQQARARGMQLDFGRGMSCFMGKDKHIIAFPIKNNTMINVVAYTCDHSVPWGAAAFPEGAPWVTPRSSSELLTAFADFSSDLQILLSCIDTPSAWAIHAVDPPLETYARGRVAILGDAAHAMQPHLGAGAGQGLEDARALVALLSHPRVRRDNIQAVFLAYDSLRRPRANKVLATSTRAGRIYDGHGPHAAEGSEGNRKDLTGLYDGLFDYNLNEAIEASNASLEDRGIL